MPPLTNEANSQAQSNKDKARKLMTIIDRLKARKSNWNDTWEEVLENFAPQRNRIFDKTTGAERGHQLYDSTPQHFVELLASALHSMLTNPSVHWFGLGTGDPEIDGKTVNKKYIQKLVAMVHDTLNATNFQTEIHELYLDLVTLGTGIMLIEEDKDLLIRFTTIPVFEMDLEEDHNGVIKTAARKIEMRVDQAFEKYGEKAFGTCAVKLKKDLTQKINITHLVMKREDANLNKLDPLNKPFGSYHIYEEEKLLLKEHGYDSFPYVAPRWTKMGNETYGRSPAIKTVYDARMLQQMMKTVIRGAQKAVDPPYLIGHDSVLGRLNLTAGGVTAARHGMMDSVKPLVSGARVDIGLEMVNQVRLNIKQGFFIDQLQLGGSDRMTELEVNIRNDENLRLLSPILGRLHNEMLDPTVGLILTILMKKKKLPKNTPVDLQENQLQMTYRSQIAKAQTANEGRLLSNYIAEVTDLSAKLQKPEMLDVLDFDQVLRIKANLDGIPMAIFQDDEDSDDIREARGQAGAEEEEMGRQNLEADTLQKEANALK